MDLHEDLQMIERNVEGGLVDRSSCRAHEEEGAAALAVQYH